MYLRKIWKVLVVECSHCGKHASHVSRLIGPWCSEECREVLLKQRADYEQELHDYDLSTIPEFLTVPDFERLAIAVAIQFLDRMTEAERKEWSSKLAVLPIPDQLALAIKEHVVKGLPEQYVEVTPTTGLKHLFVQAGTYTFRQPVPRDLIISGLIEIGINITFSPNQTPADRGD